MQVCFAMAMKISFSFHLLVYWNNSNVLVTTVCKKAKKNYFVCSDHINKINKLTNLDTHTHLKIIWTNTTFCENSSIGGPSTDTCHFLKDCFN